MDFVPALVFLVCFSCCGLCDQWDQPIGVIGGIGVVPVVGSGINDCTCPIGTRCSLSLGAVQCIPEGRSFDVGLDYGVDLDRRVLPRGGQCFPLSPLCRATRYDRYRECRYTYSSVRGRCVKVYVTYSCSRYNSRRRNLFHSRYMCERSCERGVFSLIGY